MKDRSSKIYNCNKFYMCNNIDNEISYICKNEYEFFLSKPNVEGIGLGYKEINKKCVFRKCIKVFVTKKIPIYNLSLYESIPRVYKGIETDVVQTGTFSLCSLTQKVRPALLGYSIGPASVSIAGTMGGLVKDKSGQYYILGCNHVMADLNKLSIGTQILQPSLYDGGKKDSDTIAVLSKYIPIKFQSFFRTPKNYVDAAIAKVTDVSLVESQIAIIDQCPDGVSSPKLGETVYKVGRTTELTSGSIVAINSTVMQRIPEGNALFVNQIITTGICDVGDSGALVLNYYLDALGMIMSCTHDKKYTRCNAIEDVLRELDVELVKDK